MYQAREAQLRASRELVRRLSFTQPEPEDMAVTGQIVAVVSVLEHMIIGGNCYFSLREQGEGIIIETAKKELPRYNRGSFKKVPQKIG